MKAIKMGSRIVLWAAGLLMAGAVFGQPPLTTIDDMLYKADGSPFDGELAINWRSFEGPGLTNVPTNSVTARVHNGRLHLRLVPTTTARTAAYYSVRYMTSGSEQFTELWSVPPSDTNLLVRDVRIEWPPLTTGIVAPATDITIADVEGLTAALDGRATKGLGYIPSRAAVIGATGDLEAASGGLGDCLRVDGTTGPCGGLGGEAGFADNETPSGVIDGANATFVMAGSPSPTDSLLLHRNGLLQKRGEDYSIIGNTVTFVSGAIPQSGDLLLASYRTIAELTATYGFVDTEIPTGTIDGSNLTFNLAATPNPTTSLLLYRNGLLQKMGVDYALGGNTIVTFPVGWAPQPGDIIQAWYRTGN